MHSKEPGHADGKDRPKGGLRMIYKKKNFHLASVSICTWTKSTVFGWESIVDGWKLSVFG